MIDKLIPLVINIVWCGTCIVIANIITKAK